MSKITVTFNTDNIDDKMEFMRYVKGQNMAIVLFEMSYNVYKEIIEKALEDVNPTEDSNGELVYKDYIEGYIAGVDDIMDRFNKLIEEENINIEEITQ